MPKETKKQKDILKFEKKYDISSFSPNSFEKRIIGNFSESNIIGKPTKTSIDIIKRFFLNKVATLALIIFLVIVLLSILIPSLSPYSPETPVSGIDPTIIRNLPPSWLNEGKIIVPYTKTFEETLNSLNIEYTKGIKGALEYIEYSAYGSSGAGWSISSFSWLGTNISGEDIWVRLWYGTKMSLALAILVATVETILGVTIGAIIGFHAGSKIDLYLMRVIEIINSIPALIWFILLLFIFPPGFWSMFGALVLVGWLRPVSSTRMFILRIKDSEYIKSAESIGVSKVGIIFKHALPNILGKVMIQFVGRVPLVIFAEATLAFLGLSSDPQAATLGNIINDAKGQIDNWWYITAPTILILSITLSLHLVSIGIHDAFDPKAGK